MISDSAIITIRVAALAILLATAPAAAQQFPTTPPPLRWEEVPPSGVRANRWRGGLLVRAWAPVGGSGVVVVGDMLPRELLLDLESTTAAHATFQEMKLQRGTVTATTVLVFLAVTLLLLFATVWVGLFLSRRFTEPLLAVAAATQRVAEGNRLEEVTIPASDEVAVLVDSFNAMVRRVRATEAEILASNQELGTLLATVPTGVLTVSPDGSRFRPNPAAAPSTPVSASPNRSVCPASFAFAKTAATVWPGLHLRDDAGVQERPAPAEGVEALAEGARLIVEEGRRREEVALRDPRRPEGPAACGAFRFRSLPPAAAILSTRPSSRLDLHAEEHPWSTPSSS